MILAMQASNSTDSNIFKSKIMDVANAPGQKINPGELGKALKILASGGEVDYVGASDVELVGAGESAGSFQEIVVKNQKITPVQFH
jgi:branched-chain amino acid transport system substrate-binding protein